MSRLNPKRARAADWFLGAPGGGKQVDDKAYGVRRKHKPVGMSASRWRRAHSFVVLRAEHSDANAPGDSREEREESLLKTLPTAAK